MFSNLRYLENGTMKQKEVYQFLRDLGVMNTLAEYSPVLCGTIPLGIDVENSDLDIILEVKDFDVFSQYVKALYGQLEGFTLQQTETYITINFEHKGYHLELYGENKPVKQQNAYVHMVIEHYLMKKNPTLKEQVIELKKQGMKTEAAFCEILGIKGDPYIGLIDYAKK